ncbi:MAG TPA: class I tRNA ligase family protein, partial [Firmicutes bacterium]|nr:class I tRNA ligase family protein [Bacillota bacterium]
DFLWDSFCDWYIEIAKIRMQSGDEEKAQSARQVLVWVMTRTLQLLHPFMPYITEEIWQSLPHEGESIMVSPWPVYEEQYSYPQAEEELARIMELIRGVRNRRAEMNVAPSKKAKLYIATAHPQAYETCRAILMKLAYANDMEIGEDFQLEGAVTVVTADAKAYIPMDELVDKKAELARLQKELDNAKKQLAGVDAKLNNEKFISKAPAAIIEGARQNGEKLRERIRMIEESMKALQ